MSADGRTWHPARGAFLVPHKALAKLVRGKLKAALANKRPDLIVPKAAWTRPWVVHIAHWGEGAEAVLRYLARYVFRTAITNTRILGLDDRSVTIRYKHRKSSRRQNCALQGHEFVRRFLQHVLPAGLHKVRYFGLWHPSKRHLAAQARLLLELERIAPPELSSKPAAPADLKAAAQSVANSPEASTSAQPRICPCCGLGHLIHIRRLPKNPLGP